MDSRGRQQDGLQGSLDDIHSVSSLSVGGLREDFVFLLQNVLWVTPANAQVTFPMTDVTLNCVDVATTQHSRFDKKERGNFR